MNTNSTVACNDTTFTLPDQELGSYTVDNINATSITANTVTVNTLDHRNSVN